jgi:RNA-directed DNA polymerase
MDGGDTREPPDSSAQSKSPSTLRNFMHGNRETCGASVPVRAADRREKVKSHTARMHAPEESDRGVVPKSRSNNEAQAKAESGEGRPRIKENASPTYTQPTQSGGRVSQGLAGVRQAARQRKQEKFTALFHHLTEALLRDSFYGLKKEAATGVDGVTWREYETGLAERLQDLHSRVHRGAYRAYPSRRMYVPKTDGRQRPIGIAALEDKIVQGAVVMILNQIYEEDFLGFSYGFRPGRSQHDALDALTVGIERKPVNWVLDADIRGFFDNLDHEWLLKFLQHRVADPRMLRLIQKWMKAGVSEEGHWYETKVGTPQGAVMTPRTQKITSNLTGGWDSDGSQVRIDSCHMRLYVYDRCHAPARSRKPNASIARATCCCMSINSPTRSNSWPRTAPFRHVKPIGTSNKLNG